MAYSSSKLVLITLLLASLILAMNIIAASARKLDIIKSTDHHDLTVRKLGGEELEGPPTPTSCWDALLELQSCSGEVVLFFMNGEARLGANCCNAISTITQQCWPSMLGSTGITTEESDILRGYCDAIAHGDGDGGPPALHPSRQLTEHPTRF